MNELPKVKENIIFDDIFIDKIINAKKNATIRNSPVSLGYKKISNDLTIEIVSCEKMEIDFEVYTKKFMAKAHNRTFFTALRHEALGFNSHKEMYDYYIDYHKRDFAYIMTFVRVELL